MALANYFSKDLLAINRLVNTSHPILEEMLNKTVVTIAFDENAIKTVEGKFGLDLIIRLLARLYPKIKLVDLSERNEEKKVELISLAKEINSGIEIVSPECEEDIYIVAGYTSKEIISKGLIINFGSDNWISKFSTSTRKSFGSTENPFGCGISACIVASNVFRYIFRDFLKDNLFDTELEMSVFTLSMEETETINPILENIIFDDVIVVGVGAIGNGLIWALSNLTSLKGDIQLIDHETISLSNLQRYILFKEIDKDRDKIEIAGSFFKQENLKVSLLKGKWIDYVIYRGNWNINCVAVGIDNEKDRIGIQNSLPKYIYNAFTETESIGITRHKDFEMRACLACSYIPTKKKKDFIVEVAENCNIPDKSEMVKDYYNLQKTVDEVWGPKYNESLLDAVGNANGINISDLSQFVGMQINQFYSNFVCGGVILKLTNVENKIVNVDAPLAFQSAMAGILLAAELVKHFINPDLVLEDRTDIYHLSPMQKGFNPYHRIIEKDKTNRCFCKDEDFIKRYKEKWMN